MPGKIGFAEYFAINGTAAIISKTSLAPLERVQLLVQNQNEIVKSGRLERPYKGVTDCIVRTFRNEGILPFWKGNVASILLVFSNHATSYVFKEKIKAMLNPSPTESLTTTLGKNVLSGGVAGALSYSVVYSLSYCRTRLANDVKVVGKDGERQFKGIVDVYKKTFQSDGIVGLYRGFAVSCVGIVVFRACYFGFYDTLKPVVTGDGGSLLPSFALGFIVTISAGLVSYPFDTVRNRMLMRSCEAVKYKGSIDCAVQIIRNEGFMSLMKGVSVNIIRGFVGAALLPGFDILKTNYIKWRVDN